MDTRTRKQILDQDAYMDEREVGPDLDSLSDDELEALLFDEPEEKPRGFWNLPTAAGLSLIVVGMVYVFQVMGIWNGFDVAALASMLPWLAGILIILLGFGVLSWRPNKKKRKTTARRAYDVSSGKQKVIVETTVGRGEKRRLMKSRDKKFLGVCGGVADYFGLDPTLVRIAFVIGSIVTNGALLIAYFILNYVMPKPDSVQEEQRITIIRDR